MKQQVCDQSKQIKMNLRFLIYFLGSIFLFTNEVKTQVLSGPGGKINFDNLSIDEVINIIDSIGKNDLEKAKEYCSEYISYNKSIGNFNQLGRSWEMMASLYWVAGDLAKGISSHHNARAGYFKAGNKGKAAYCLSSIGLYKYYSGERDSAMVYYLSSIKELQETSSFHELAIAYYNLGNFFSDMKNYSKGSLYQSQAINIARKNKDTSILINTLYALGKIKVATGDLSKAYASMREASMYAEAIRRPTLVGMINADLCEIALNVNRVESALYFGKKSMEAALEVKDIQTYMEASVNLSNVYDKTGNTSERNKILREALAKEKEASDTWFTIGIYRWLAKASFKLGDYKRAYELLANADYVDDSIKRASSNRLNTEMEMKFQTAQKEKELSIKQLQLAQKDLQIQKNRTVMYYTVAVLVVVLLIALILFLQVRNKRLAHARELKSVQQQKDLQLMQALMNGEEKERSRIAKDLHDGVAGMLAAVKMHFSTISVQLEDVVHTEGYKRGLNLLDEASKEIRKTSHNLMPEVLLQHGIDEALSRYCSNISNVSSIIIEYDSLGNISRFVESFELSVYRIIQELLNNILKHSKASHALVQVSQQNDILTIAIEDNGIGLKKDSMDTDGMGIKSLRSRIKAINGKMELESGEGTGVSAYLEFEIDSYKKERSNKYEQDQVRNN